MEAMLILGIIALIIITIARSSGKKEDVNSLTQTIKLLASEIRNLRIEIEELKTDLKLPRAEATPPPVVDYEPYKPKPTPQQEAPPPPIFVEEVIAPPVVETLQPVEAPAVAELAPEQESVAAAPLQADSAEETFAAPQATPTFTEPVQQPDAAHAHETDDSPMGKWARNNPDLEKFIGENLINKIGIAILVLGIAFFVKYAIDQNWINEVGRVSIGMGCGAILVGLAHYLRNTYRSFSSVLAGGGIAVFYFTIAFAYHQYHLMPQAAAFVIMVVITAFAVALSVLYDKLELAIIATVGGFLAPFMVSSGEGNYITLFVYLIVLNVGLLSLSWFKRWTPINIIALIFTDIIFAGWLGTSLSDNKVISYPLGLLFATVFYLLFMGMNMLHQVRNKTQFKAFDFMLLLFITSTYYGAGMTILHYWNAGAYQGLFTLALGFINLGLAYYVYKNGKADRNLFFLLIGLTLSFLTLTIPIQLHGHAITLFWSAEFVLLYWLSGYSGIRIFKYSSMLVCGLAFISLLMDWSAVSSLNGSQLRLIYNSTQGLVTNLVAVAAFGVYYYLLRKNGDEEFIEGISARNMSSLFLSVAVGLLYLTFIFGVNLIYKTLSVYDIPNVYHRMITEAFALAILLYRQRKPDRRSVWPVFAPLVVAYVVYLFSAGLIANLRDGVLANRYSGMVMAAHWADSVLLAVILYLTIQAVRAVSDKVADNVKAISIFFTLISLSFLSLELMQVYIIAAYHNGNTTMLIGQYGKAGLTVIWALSSFALMWLGMKHRQKTLRIISLTLFSVVLVKLFAFDISGISEGGKILAFILLGALLLTVSFMYQKLKKIIIDDHKE